MNSWLVGHHKERIGEVEFFHLNGVPPDLLAWVRQHPLEQLVTWVDTTAGDAAITIGLRGPCGLIPTDEDPEDVLNAKLGKFSEWISEQEDLPTTAPMKGNIVSVEHQANWMRTVATWEEDSSMMGHIYTAITCELLVMCCEQRPLKPELFDLYLNLEEWTKAGYSKAALLEMDKTTILKSYLLFKEAFPDGPSNRNRWPHIEVPLVVQTQFACREERAYAPGAHENRNSSERADCGNGAKIECGI